MTTTLHSSATERRHPASHPIGANEAYDRVATPPPPKNDIPFNVQTRTGILTPRARLKKQTYFCIMALLQATKKQLKR